MQGEHCHRGGVTRWRMKERRRLLGDLWERVGSDTHVCLGKDGYLERLESRSEVGPGQEEAGAGGG